MKVWYHILDKNNVKNYSNFVVGNDYFADRVNSFRFESDKAKRVVAYLLLKQAMIYSGTPLSLMDNIQTTVYRKPYIKNWHNFNFSYSHNCVVLLQGNMDSIGVDIEYIKDIDVIPLLWMLHIQERNFVLRSKNKKRAFYEIWTRKEAVLKASETGITNEIGMLNCINNKVPYLNDVWTLKKIQITNNYICHMAAKKSIEKIKIFELKKEILYC